MTLSSLDPANPFATPSALPYGLPDFTVIREEHYLPALLAGMAEQRAEIEAIATDPEAPTPEKTLDRLERSGRLLHRAATAFFNQSSADATAGLDQIEEEVAPLLAAHHDAIHQDARLFARIEALHAAAQAGDLDLAPDTAWLLHRQRIAFERSGIALDAGAQARLRALNAEITSLETVVGREILAGANSSAVLVADAAELDGMPSDARAAAAQAATERGHDGKWLIELQLPTQQGVLAALRDRTLRERVHTASVQRGSAGDDHDTRATVLALARLRAERAQLLGYPHHAGYVAAD
ncbi:MAG TPA: M3 family peptidase, partial [Cellulomonas sp.]